MAFFDPQKAREQYLERLLVRYETVTLPLDSARHTLPLHTVFQPLVLHRDPLAPPDERSTEAAGVVRARDGAEALAKSEHGRMVVLGGPGMGKTTALKALLYMAITKAQDDPAAPLPHFISLPDLMRAGLSFAVYSQRLSAELAIDPRFAHILLAAVQDGNAFLCLDSLDEVLPALRPDVIAFLNTEAPRCRGTWIIGSRFTEYKGGQFAHSQFTEWELQALDKQERLTLARHLLPVLYDAFYRDVAPALKPALPSAEAYIAELQQNTPIAPWGENPLLLSLAAVFYTQTGGLPASRAVLYAQVTEAMFTMRIHDARQRAELRQLLADIALEFYQTRGRNCSITDLLEFLPSLVSNQSTQVLYAMLALLLDSGMLEPVAYQVYGFKHQMFQEYLAAVALARRCVDEAQRQSAWSLLWRKRRFSRWHEILRLLVGILVQEHGARGLQIAHEWLSALALEYSTPEGDPGNLCLLLALRSLGEFGERIAEPEVADLAQHILEMWAKRFVELSRLGGWRYTQPLRVQATVLWAFSLHTVAPILMHLQQYDPDIQSFCHGAAAPGVIDHALPIHILWNLFQDRSVSFYACYTAHVLQTPAVIERLVAILEDRDRNWSIEDQVAIVRLLGKMEEQTPLPLLIQTWQDTTLHDNLRRSAAEALTEAEAFVPLDVFIAMLSDQISSIRCVAIQALGKHSQQVPADLFLSALQNAASCVRETALRSLHELGISLPLELLQTLLYDKSSITSNEAWNILQEMGERVPLVLWLDALQHEHTWVRNYALIAVERYRDHIPVEPVLAMLSAPRKTDRYRHIDVRTSCIQALGLLGERVPLEPLLALLQHSDEHIRAQALAVLTRRHVALPAPILLPMLNHSITGSAAVQAIAALGGEAPIASLVEMVRSRSSNSAQFASQALYLLYEHVPTAPILELLQDEEISNSYGGTYWELIQLLQLQGVEVSLEWLLPMLKQHVPETAIAPIIVSLCHAGAQAPIEALIRAIFAETRGTTFYPKWIQQLFYVLYEWVLPGNLTNALGNTPHDQWLAVSLLGLVHDDESIQLITAVAQDPSRDRTTRSEAMVVLSDLGVNLPLEYLLQATRWCIYEGMGEYVVDTVKRLGKQTPLEQLLPLLGEEHNRLQPGVIKVLASIADYIPLETILALLEDPNKLVRHAAIRLLGALGERAPLPVFMALLSDPEQTLETRCDVLSALGELGTPAAVDLLLQALENREARIRSGALWALKDDDPETRRGGIRVFKEQGKAIPLEPLLRLLNDPDDTAVMSAIGVLAELGSLGVAIPVAPLVSLLDHKDEYIVGEAAEALCTSGTRAPIDTLLAHMESTNEAVRDAIFYALSSLGARAPLEAMLAALSESEVSTARWRMKYALGNLAESMPEQILQRLHDDPRPAMRRIVLQAIQITRAGEWLPLVLATLHDADGRYTAHDHQCSESTDTIRSAAIQTLGTLNACAPIEPLLQLLNTNKEEHSYNDERIVVLEALKQFGSRVLLAVLWPLLGSNHREICRLAFQHLQENYPAVLHELVPVLKAIVRGEPVQSAFAARMHYRLAETVALMGRATPAVLETVIELLDYPFWEVRSRAARTLGTLRCPIPDRAIRRLLELRTDPESLTVRADADQALAELLSLEQGMEDE